jgi:hypothetical protein
LEQQRYVLSKEQIAHLLPALESTVFSEDGDVKDGVASKKWGTLCTAAGQAVHPAVSKIVHHVAANNNFIKAHSVKGQPVLRRVAVVKMDSSPPHQQDLGSSLNTTGTRMSVLLLSRCLHSLQWRAGQR